jgi:predicted protein tyrosine phosphatase
VPRIHVCSLQRVEETVRESGARSLVTLLEASLPVARPASIAPDRHLFVGVSDIVDETDGYVLAHSSHIDEFLSFVRRWDRLDPIVMHCYAGVSRSTAAAFVAACALRPERPEHYFARRLRQASPTATPNARLVALADQLLGRNGRMVAAVTAIGRGAECFEGVPFALDLA